MKAVICKINCFAKNSEIPSLSEHREVFAIHSTCLGYTSAFCKHAAPMVLNTESHEGKTEPDIF